ncbi:MAG: TRAP transporter substrate-binding protein [Candidatus Accumulibacter sp.]|jgi:TRAP-type C4-dicarboxylate transport system substrate-binding protein|nr:TRAP transporter substrate-binding protein [Accumulibacter sp.]
MSALSRRSFLKSASLGAFALSAPAIAGRASAAIPVVCASLLSEDKPETKIWLKIRSLVEEKLPGRFAFNIVTNGALGGERETGEGMRLGAIQAGLSTLSALSAWVPEAQLFDMPFLFRDDGHLGRALSGAPGESLRQKLAAQNFVAPGFIRYGARHLLARTPLTRAGMMRGKRVRVLQSPLHVELWKSYGALPVTLPITEAHDALSTGVVDAMDLTIPAYEGFKLYEVVPKVILTGHIRAAGAVMFSGAFWNRLAAVERAAFAAAAVEGAAYFDELMRADEAASAEIARKGGAEFIAAEDMPAWEKGARPLWSAFAGRVGGIEAIDAVRALA